MWRGISDKTNCFTYSLAVHKHGWGRPGQLSLKEGFPLERSEINNEEIKGRLLKNDFVLVDGFDKAATDTHVIAAFICAGRDFHFYRLDRDGLWSHKSGESLVKKKDKLGDLIEDPQKAARGIYNEFVGFFVVPETGISYYPRLDEQSYSGPSSIW